MDQAAREKAAADEAASALQSLTTRVAALAAVEWSSPAAGLYRASIDSIASDCDTLRLRLLCHTPQDR